MTTQFSGSGFRRDGRGRAVPLMLALLVQFLFAFALLNGLPSGGVARVARALEAFAIPVPPPPKPVRPPVSAAPARPAAASASASAPAPRPPAPHPALAAAAPLTTAPSPAIAAVDIPNLGVAAVGGGGGGTGSGAGGAGNGSGAGSGSGGGGGEGVPAEWLRGRITPDDFPSSVYRHGARIQLASRFVIGTDGRVESCSVTESSGNPDLDAQTCRLIVERYRFRPARDADGHPIREEQSRHHYWGMAPPGDG